MKLNTFQWTAIKLPAREIQVTPTHALSLFADTVSLHLSHKINVPPNRKAILQCITLSEWTSVLQPVSLNLSLICLVLLWALRINSIVPLSSCWSLHIAGPHHAQRERMKLWAEGTAGVTFYILCCSLLESMQLFPLSLRLWRCAEMLHCNMSPCSASCCQGAIISVFK